MADQQQSRVPGANEPDEQNIRLRSFQGGTDSLPGQATGNQTYGDTRYADDQGPFADTPLPNGAGAGLSGLPQASAGLAPARFNEPTGDPSVPQRGSGS